MQKIAYTLMVLFWLWIVGLFFRYVVHAPCQISDARVVKLRMLARVK
jgi:hypothetical protein